MSLSLSVSSSDMSPNNSIWLFFILQTSEKAIIFLNFHNIYISHYGSFNRIQRNWFNTCLFVCFPLGQSEAIIQFY